MRSPTARGRRSRPSVPSRHWSYDVAVSDTPGPLLPWHRALVYAVLGQAGDELGRQQQPDLAEVEAEILARVPQERAGLRNLVRDRRAAGAAWPFPVPDELRRDLGAAQWVAALAELRRRLDVETAVVRPVAGDRPPDADELRLLREVPPHHGH